MVLALADVSDAINDTESTELEMKPSRGDL
jgi:hypothetical protein